MFNAWQGWLASATPREIRCAGHITAPSLEIGPAQSMLSAEMEVGSWNMLAFSNSDMISADHKVDVDSRPGDIHTQRTPAHALERQTVTQLSTCNVGSIAHAFHPPPLARFNDHHHNNNTDDITDHAKT